MKAKANMRCQECGRATERLAVHHVLPVEDTDDPDEMERRCFDETNLRVLCYDCHKQKHENRIGTHADRERQRTQRMHAAIDRIDISDGFDF